MAFKREWLKYYTRMPKLENMNIYMVADPASSQSKRSDYTCYWVIGYNEDKNYYILDGYHDKATMRDRVDVLFELHRKWKPINVAYERYGMMEDINYIKDKQAEEGYSFKITEVAGSFSKESRIKRLQADFENGRIILPEKLNKVNWEYKKVDLVKEFVDEYNAFPVSTHDDMLDSLSRIKDISTFYPEAAENYEADDYDYERDSVTGY